MSLPLAKWKQEVRDVFAVPAMRVLTIFITNRCNAKCSTCFYWMNLNKPTDALDLEEYQRVADASPLVEHLLFSGGEPTMDPHIVDVAKMFVREPYQTLTMPTNGIITRQVMSVVEGFVESFPGNRITIGVSFDGLAETHDRIRGVPRNFEKSLVTLRELCRLREECPNLRITPLSVILKQNAEELLDLIDFFDRETEVDYVTVEPLRGQRKDMELAAPSLDQLRAVQDKAFDVNLRRMKERHPWEATTLLSHLDQLYNIQQNFYETNQLGVTCLAGEVSAVLEVNGEIRCCELLGTLGNVRDHGYSLDQALKTAAADRERAMIRSGACACTHCVNIGQSFLFDRKAAARRLLRQKYLAWKLFHSPF